MALGKGLGAILEEVGQAYDLEMVDSEHMEIGKKNLLVEELFIWKIKSKHLF